MNDLQIGDRVRFKNIITGDVMEGKLVGGSDKYLAVYVEEKKITYVARSFETTKIEAVK